MKKKLLIFLSLTALLTNSSFSQCIHTSVAAADVTLQCSGGTGNRTGVVFHPGYNLYYSVNAGSSSYPLETFSVTGGVALNNNTQGADYRGYWWNPITGLPEGNTFSNGGVYSNTINASGYALTAVTLMSGATMPNAQSCGTADFVGNRIIYYDAGTIYRYNKTTNTFISSSPISGLPVPTGNLNLYGVVYTGVPGKELGVYDYINKVLYLLNINTAAYSGSCALPSSAPAANSFKMGFANNRLFLHDGGTGGKREKNK